MIRKNRIITVLVVVAIAGGALAYIASSGNTPIKPTPKHVSTTFSLVDSPPTTPGPNVCDNAALLTGPANPPAGATVVAAGSYSVQNAALGSLLPANTTYYFAAGVHHMANSNGSSTLEILPGNHDTFIGAPGAILDGGGYAPIAFANPMFTNGFTSNGTGVTIEYLTIQFYNTPAGSGTVNGGQFPSPNWTIEHDTIQDNVPGPGVEIGTGNIVTNNCLTQNGEYAFNGYLGAGNSEDPADSLTAGATDVTVTDNEISYNDTCDFEDAQPFPNDIIPPANCLWTSVNTTAFTGTPNSMEYEGCGCSGGGKFWETDGGLIAGNYVHDNENVGIWWDTNDVAMNVVDNYVSDNWGIGLEYEASYNAVMEYNALVGNAWGLGACGAGCDVGGFAVGAIYLSESGYDPAVPDSALPGFSQTAFAVEDNYFNDNWGNVVLWENPDRFCGSPEEPNDTPHCVLANPATYNTECLGSFCPFSAQSPPCSSANGCSGSEWPGTCGSMTPASSTDAGTATPSTSLTSSSPGSALYVGCRWKTENVQVAGNIFNLDGSATTCNPNNAGPYCMPSTCTSGNDCAESAIMSTTANTAPYDNGSGTDIETRITTEQNNIFCQNNYTGQGTPQFMYPSQGTVISKSTWKSDGQDTATCANAPPAVSFIFSPPPSFLAITPSGPTYYPIDANGCQDGIDSTVSLENWLNSLPPGTVADPTIVDFSQTACYLINGTLFLYGYENFQFNGGKFEQQTEEAGPETRACVTAANGGTDALSFCQGSTAPAQFGGANEQDGLYTDSLTIGQDVCKQNGTGPITSGGYTNPSATNGGTNNGTEPDTDTDATGDYDFVLMWMFEGGCNIVMNNMVLIGSNLDGATQGTATQQDTLITFAGTQYAVVNDVSMDDSFGDCVDSDGLHEAPGTGGEYPGLNITVENSLCGNAGRDDMSVISADNITYENNTVYTVAATVFDFETDLVCQDGSENNEAILNNTVLADPDGNVDDVFSGQTDSPTSDFEFAGNTLGPGVQMRFVLNDREQQYVEDNSTNTCVSETGTEGQNVTIANNTWTQPNTGGGTYPEPFADDGVSPLYVYGNNGPMGASSNYYVDATNVNGGMVASVDNNVINGVGDLNHNNDIVFNSPNDTTSGANDADTAVNVNGGSASGTSVTLDFNSGPLFQTGSQIIVSGVTGFSPEPNGTFTVTGETATSVTFTTSSTTGSWASGGTILNPPPQGAGYDSYSHCGNTGTAMPNTDNTCGSSDPQVVPTLAAIALLPIGYTIPPPSRYIVGNLPGL